jgi:hypothetical protein
VFVNQPCGTGGWIVVVQGSSWVIEDSTQLDPIRQLITQPWAIDRGTDGLFPSQFAHQSATIRTLVTPSAAAIVGDDLISANMAHRLHPHP